MSARVAFLIYYQGLLGTVLKFIGMFIPNTRFVVIFETSGAVQTVLPTLLRNVPLGSREFERDFDAG